MSIQSPGTSSNKYFLRTLEILFEMLGKRKKSEEEQTSRQDDRSEIKLAKSDEMASIHKEDLELSLPVEILSKIISIFFHFCEKNDIFRSISSLLPFLEMRRCCKLFNDIVVSLIETRIRKHLADSKVSKYMSLGDYFERMNRLGINYKRNLARFARISDYQLWVDCDLFTAPKDRKSLLERDAKIPLGASKYGGWPHLPVDWQYPQGKYDWEDSTPINLEFMMQVSCCFSFHQKQHCYLILTIPFVYKDSLQGAFGI